jgi:hypothetical protein
MTRVDLFDKNVTLYPLYINLDNSVKDMVGLGVVTSVHNVFGISFLDHPFSTVIHSIKNSVRKKYNDKRG